MDLGGFEPPTSSMRRGKSPISGVYSGPPESVMHLHLAQIHLDSSSPDEPPDLNDLDAIWTRY